MTGQIKINGHGHLLPYPEEIPAFMREKRLFWLDADRKFMRQGDWRRPVTDPSFFLDEKLEWMARNGIHHEVVLNLSQLYANGYPEALALDITRFQNDFNASLQARHPDKFTTGFVLPLAYTDAALREMRRCREELGMDLLCLPTHYQTPAGEWRTVACEALAPIWQAADDYGIAIEIHPYNTEKIVNLPNTHWRFHLIWMCALTADTFHFFTLRDFPAKYPNTRICFAHGNQYAQVNIGRRQQGFDGRPDLFEGSVSPSSNLQAPNVFFDTLVHDVDSFQLLVKRQGVSQIVAGLDDPYPLGEMESVPGCWPGKVIDEAVGQGIISEADRTDIWHGNVIRWLYGGEDKAFLERIKVQ